MSQRDGEGECEGWKIVRVLRAWGSARSFPLFVILVVAVMLFVQ